MKVVNPSATTLSLGGIMIVRGFADGEYFSAEPSADVVSSVVGTDGEVVATLTGDARWEGVLKLMESSDHNLALSTFYNLKKRAGTLGFFPFLYRDADTGEFLSGGDACIMRAPAISKDRGAKPREWKILITNAEYGYA